MKIILFLIFIVIPLHVQAQQILINEDFSSLDDWEKLLFPKISRHTVYSIADDGAGSDSGSGTGSLKIESDASASAMIHISEFNVNEWPVLQWRWKADNIFNNGNALKKSGDDFPVRIYIIFEFDPVNAGKIRKAGYDLAKLVYGQYPPDSALNYVWSSTSWKERVIPNAFTDSAMMIASDSGSEHTGLWREHRVNILEDYRQAFGKEPPSKAKIAVMGDSDNTGETSVSHIDYIRIMK